MNTHLYTRAALGRLIDHTLLNPVATVDHVNRLCDECVEHGFYAACVRPAWVRRCVERLRGTDTVVAAVVGLPCGGAPADSGAVEARAIIESGAREIDLVVNLPALTAGDRATVVGDISAVVDVVKQTDADVLVKVILETAALTDEQIILGCRCIAEAQADFVKTSTGLHPAGGATVRHVALLRKHIAPLKIKASGGIGDLPTALSMLEAGADRLGTSHGVALVESMPEEAEVSTP